MKKGAGNFEVSSCLNTMINPLAVELNDAIKSKNQYIFDMLSNLGIRMYFPKGILSQGAEARAKAYKTDATIGIAVENAMPMHLPSIQSHIRDISPKDSYDYAPASGKAELRKAWLNKIYENNPMLRGKVLSNPIVTNGLTHGLSIIGDLFVNPGDVIITPDKIWENYTLMYSVRYGAELRTFPFYDGNGFNIDGFRKALVENGEKIIVILNFPNNPTGYTPTIRESEEIAKALYDAADSGCNIIAICDDAYFGLFYDEDANKESISGYLAGLHPGILTIKADAATKEEYVWGFRVGFITFCLHDTDGKDEIFNALERKVMGCIRSSISNCSNLSQSLVLEALRSTSSADERAQKAKILKSRALRAREVLKEDKYKDAWDMYPFNSGYFLCLKLKNVDSEKLRVHLLQNYGVGVIALDKADIRIAFSCVEEDKIEELFDTIYKAVKDLS